MTSSSPNLGAALLPSGNLHGPSTFWRPSSPSSPQSSTFDSPSSPILPPLLSTFNMSIFYIIDTCSYLMSVHLFLHLSSITIYSSYLLSSSTHPPHLSISICSHPVPSPPTCPTLSMVARPLPSYMPHPLNGCTFPFRPPHNLLLL